jgi:hypothetical protein
MLLVWIMAPILLACCWVLGDVEFRTKLIVTVVYLATWALIFVNVYAQAAAQALFCAVVGLMTFGPDWGRR